MTAFQIVGVVFSGAMALLSLRSVFTRPGRRITPLFWLVTWTIATVAFVEPDNTTVVARAMGIERGVDLVLYCAVLAGAVGFWLVSVRLREQNRQITQLTREIALRDAEDVQRSGAQEAP